LLFAALAALLPAACGYPDSALAPPARAPAANAAPAAAADPLADPLADLSRDARLGAPFVVIRFGPEPVDFEAPLAEAVAEVRARRPDAAFHLLALTPAAAPALPGAPALRHAEAVLRSLAALGVPPERVSLAAARVPSLSVDEVRLYLR
jgi:hypothetical protein